MIKRIVKMTFREDGIAAFKDVYRNNWTHIRNFPGCAHVELLEETSGRGVFFTYSIWDSEESLENYRTSELFKTIWAATRSLFREKAQAWTVDELKFG